MFDTVVIATDGSESAARSVETAVDFARRFEAEVHALYVIDTDEIENSPAEIREDLATAIKSAGDDALAFAEDEAGGAIELVTAVREGDPHTEITTYADAVDADVIAMGTRGRDGDHAFLLGSVAEAVVRSASQPVLTVRQLEDAEPA
ncbi:universal stress protein [Halovenus halobia]|uniref:universal stress protein n=1 Tax=Halovenus halobia TaxID=3396622 RepID=UPI003F559390